MILGSNLNTGHCNALSKLFANFCNQRIAIKKITFFFYFCGFPILVLKTQFPFYLKVGQIGGIGEGKFVLRGCMGSLLYR